MREEVGKQRWSEIPPSKVRPQGAEVHPKEGLALAPTSQVSLPALFPSPRCLLPTYNYPSSHMGKTTSERGNETEVEEL